MAIDAITMLGQPTQDKSMNFMRALAYIRAEKHKLALEELDKIDPKDVEALLMKAKIYWKIGQIKEGNKLFWQAHAINQTHPEVKEFIAIIKPKAVACYEKAMYSMLEGNLDDALVTAARGIEIYPRLCKLFLLRATIWRKKFDYGKAIDDLEEASKWMEEDGVDKEVKIQIGITYNEIGLILMKTKKMDGALNVFNEALKYISGDYGVHINRGDVYRDMGNINLALSDYHYAIDLGAPSNIVQYRLAIVHYLQGIQCFNLRDYNGALIEFSRAIEANPCAEYYKKRILCNEQLRKHSDMINDLRTLTNIDKSDQWAKAYLQKLV